MVLAVIFVFQLIVVLLIAYFKYKPDALKIWRSTPVDSRIPLNGVWSNHGQSINIFHKSDTVLIATFNDVEAPIVGTFDPDTNNIVFANGRRYVWDNFHALVDIQDIDILTRQGSISPHAQNYDRAGLWASPNGDIMELKSEDFLSWGYLNDDRIAMVSSNAFLVGKKFQAIQRDRDVLYMQSPDNKIVEFDRVL